MTECRSNAPLFCFTVAVSSTMASSDRTESIRSLDLTMAQILKAVPPRTFKMGERRSRAKLEAAIYNLLQWKYDLIVGASVAKRCRLDSNVSPIVQPANILPPVIRCLLMTKMNSFSKSFPKSVDESV